VVVNERPTVPRADYDRLRAILHNCARSGPDAQNRDGVTDFRSHLLGRIAWVGSLDPGRGERLRAAFDAITW
jgi:RNA-directed DNA polymerase